MYGWINYMYKGKSGSRKVNIPDNILRTGKEDAWASKFIKKNIGYSAKITEIGW